MCDIQECNWLKYKTQPRMRFPQPAPQPFKESGVCASLASLPCFSLHHLCSLFSIRSLSMSSIPRLPWYRIRVSLGAAVCGVIMAQQNAQLARSQRRSQTPEQKGNWTLCERKGTSELCSGYSAVSYSLSNDIHELQINIHSTFEWLLVLDDVSWNVILHKDRRP